MQTYNSTESSQIVNQLIKDNGYTSYLEIGYKDGMIFNKIQCDTRIAVDENPRGDIFEEKLHYNSCYLREDGSLLLKEDPAEFFERNRDFGYDVIFLNDMEDFADKAIHLLASNGILIMNRCPSKVISSAYTTTLQGDLLITKRKDERVDIH